MRRRFVYDDDPAIYIRVTVEGKRKWVNIGNLDLERSENPQIVSNYTVSQIQRLIRYGRSESLE